MRNKKCKKKQPPSDGKQFVSVEVHTGMLVILKGSMNGQVQVFIDGKLVRGVIGYKIEHNSSDKKTPLLTMQVQCNEDKP